MAGLGAGGGVAQAVAHGAKLPDRSVKLLRFRRELLPVDLRLTVGREHQCDLFQRKTRRAAQRDQRQALQYIRIEEAAQPAPADRADQTAFLVVAQGRGRDAAAPRHLSNINVFHALDLKST